MTLEIAETSSLNEDERMEYIQINDFYKHDDNIAYRFGSITLASSLGAFVVFLKYPKMGIPLLSFSGILYLYWILFSERLCWFQRIRMRRVRELEKKAGLYHHRLINKHDKLKHKIKDCCSIRFLRVAFLFILVYYWLFCLYCFG